MSFKLTFLMGNIGEDYSHLITNGAMVDQVQHQLSLISQDTVLTIRTVL
jgi:hypothetical protein